MGTGCSSQILFFHNQKFTLPTLNNEQLLEFISSDVSLSVFYRLITECGDKCLDIYRSLGNDQNESLREKSGHTIFIPNDSYFEEFPSVFEDLSKSSELVEKMIKVNTFYGTYCQFYLRYDYVWKARNLLGDFVKNSDLPSVSEYEIYLSESSILVHSASFVPL